MNSRKNGGKEKGFSDSCQKCEKDVVKKTKKIWILKTLYGKHLLDFRNTWYSNLKILYESKSYFFRVECHPLFVIVNKSNQSEAGILKTQCWSNGFSEPGKSKWKHLSALFFWYHFVKYDISYQKDKQFLLCIENIKAEFFPPLDDFCME